MDIPLLCRIDGTQIERLSSGTYFALKDLFSPEEWDKLSPSDRFNIGKRFKRQVIAGEVAGVVYMGQSLGNSAQYKKV